MLNPPLTKAININYRQLSNDICKVIAQHLHYFENIETINALKTSEEVLAAFDGNGSKRYNFAVLDNAAGYYYSEFCKQKGRVSSSTSPASYRSVRRT